MNLRELQSRHGNYGIFFTTTTLGEMFDFLKMHDAGCSADELLKSISTSLALLVNTVEMYCDRIPRSIDYDDIKHAESQHDYSEDFNKLQSLLSYYSAAVKSCMDQRVLIDSMAVPVWKTFATKYGQESWFTLNITERMIDDSHAIKSVPVENPSTFDLLLGNLCYQVYAVYVHNIEFRKRDLAFDMFKGTSLGLLASCALPPLAITYSILALPFSIMTSIARHRIGLWKSIPASLIMSIIIGPGYAYKKIVGSSGQFYHGRLNLRDFNNNAHRELPASHLSQTVEVLSDAPVISAAPGTLMAKVTAAAKVCAQNGTTSEDTLLSYNSDDIEIAIYGDAIAGMIENAIVNAQHEVMIQTFAWDKSTIFVQKINQALQQIVERKKSADTGSEDAKPLHVYVLIDERGRVANFAMQGHPGRSWPSDPESLGLLNVPGLVEVHTATFHHNSPGGTHAKTVVIDNQYLILTGANFQASNSGHLPAYDAAIRIRGPIATAAREDFCVVWRDKHVQYSGERVLPPEKFHADMPVISSCTVPMLLTTRRSSSVGRHLDNPQNAAFITAIECANSIIKIATPNLNEPRIKRALLNFVKRGGRLELMLGKGFNDLRESSEAAGGTNQDTVNEFVATLTDAQRSNCDIRWFSLDGESPVIGNVAGAAHIKFMAIDEQIVIFGNANQDKVSYRFLHECNVVIDDATIAKKLSTAFFDSPFVFGIPAVLDESKHRTLLASKQHLDILRTEEAGNGFKTIILKKPDGWHAISGQYCEVRSGNYFSALFKHSIVLAIASGSNEREIRLTAKPSAMPVHANHALTRSVGQTLEVTGPMGTAFPIEFAANHPLLLIGGGSGITAIRSVVQSLPLDAEIQIIYSAKSRSEMIYGDEVDVWRQGVKNYITLTQEMVDGYHHGRFTDHLQQLVLPDNVLVFICGPSELVRETAKMLHARGVSTDSIYGSLPTDALKGGPVYRADHAMLLGRAEVAASALLK